MNRAEGHSHCLRCGRRLYSAASRAAGFGSGCRAKIRAAAKVADLAAWTGRQLEQARELIEDAGIVPTGRPGVYRTVSTDGSAVYLTTAKWCGCPASKECYHRAAVAVMQATTKAA
jgi:hypothetical protein